MPLPSAVKLAVGGRGVRNEATKVISRPVQGNDVFVKPLGIRNKVRTLLSAYIYVFPLCVLKSNLPPKNVRRLPALRLRWTVLPLGMRCLWSSLDA